MKSLQDAAQELDDLGVKVIGISRDSVAVQSKFAKEHDLEMTLLSDPDGSVVERYDVAHKRGPFARRVTFVIDPEGKIRLRDESIKDVKTHGLELVAVIEDLKGS